MPKDRADYASTRERPLGAWVQSVEDESPAWEAGIEPGMRIESVNGHELRDLIDWRWEADGASCQLEVFDPTDGGTYACELWRKPGEDWGIGFTDVLFDGIRTCVNACQFCFMSMLPSDARPSLSLRDDDYRLSFLQGNFVTLTNVRDEDAERIITYRLEPMNVSIHAISPEVRRTLIGPHAQRGIDVLERLLAAGIEIHAQIVLCPGVNDGSELARTLDWVEQRPSITSLAVVPLGYTRFSRRFSKSFSDDPDAARAVVKLIEPYQARARLRLGITRFQLSDEFYVAADMPVPPAEAYDGYPQYYDGIGMLRSFLDESAVVARDHAEELGATEKELARREITVLVVCGEAPRAAISFFSELWSPSGRVRAYPIHNDYFGGDVNVTGLIVSQDLLAQLPELLTNHVVVLPEVMFNFDHLTLDGDTQDHVMREIGRRGGVAAVAHGDPESILSTVTQSLG
ncbi:DUF512 domain-containing protein [Olsenella sp. Marseille-P4559]|uniref:DUF512 domain-containing protein n=1 Tax=Olsenella sp. Marseille-P4559 TaxID=2364795 RepID=UPI0010317C27|nr:DUF512 domain-containing protein [Olsenella sp. Marseille-P4559]